MSKSGLIINIIIPIIIVSVVILLGCISDEEDATINIIPYSVKFSEMLDLFGLMHTQLKTDTFFPITTVQLQPDCPRVPVPFFMYQAPGSLLMHSFFLILLTQCAGLPLAEAMFGL